MPTHRYTYACLPGVVQVLQREAEFFYYVAPNIGLRLPTTYWCGTVKSKGIIMDGPSGSDSKFGILKEPRSVEVDKANVAQLAEIHAGTWQKFVKDYPWLTGERGQRNQPMEGRHHATPGASTLGGSLRRIRPTTSTGAVTRPRAHAQGLPRALPLTKHHCMRHGDAHVANTFIRHGGVPSFMDFQCVVFDPPFHDLAYFFDGALTVEDPRRQEKEILRHYLKCLYEAGQKAVTNVPELGLEDVWDEYRMHIFYCSTLSLTLVGMYTAEGLFPSGGEGLRCHCE
ncbi:hypothetical protein PG994_009635 [Apiospora phragmitis]|uniref:Aminoglycoside phosphotransferase domain-containing protein n=1 Tax=Apiospora phragmitis TaxID=2905665 RepID=A0ABR1U6N2_9PEZI